MLYNQRVCSAPIFTRSVLSGLWIAGEALIDSNKEGGVGAVGA